MANDLTFQQVNTAAKLALGISGDIFFLDATRGVCLDWSKLVAESVTSLTTEKLIEGCIKIIRSCRQAQDTVNSGLSAGSRLNSFPAIATGTPFVNASDGKSYSTVTAQVVGLAPVNLDDMKGQLN
jgi:hypothetical protein